MKIHKNLSIKQTHLIYKGEEFWSEQNFLVIPPLEDLVLEVAVEARKSKYTFTPLTIRPAWFVALNDIKVGSRLDHGNSGKRGISWPAWAAEYHKDIATAEKAMTEIIAYFQDLVNKSLYGPKALKAGQVKEHFYLY